MLSNSHFLNLNGKLLSTIDIEINRAFLYSDSLFDTALFLNGKIVFSEDHFFRLLAGMRQLYLEIPSYFTHDFWEIEIKKTIEKNNLEIARVRTNIFRSSQGLYLPDQNSIGFIISTETVFLASKDIVRLGVYKDHFVNTGSLENIKTNNKLINVLASIYGKLHDFDNCLLMNNKKNISSVLNGNVFFVENGIVKTPALSQGCIKGIIRQKVIEIILNLNIELVETEISIFEASQAEEIFFTNSIVEIQSISHFKNKILKKNLSEILKLELAKYY